MVEKSIASSETGYSNVAVKKFGLVQAYLQLCKPNVVVMMLITAAVGAFLSGLVPSMPLQLVSGLVGIGLCSAAAAVVNHIYDRNIDEKMSRTQHRPVVTGEVSLQNAIVFASCLSVLGIIVLAVFNNFVAMALTLFASLGYAWFYTVVLKRRTSQNVVIGGLAGAMPPLLGWAALSGTVDSNALLLVLIIFVWTPPHFWPLALYKKEDYLNSQIPMLPLTHGEQTTRVHCVLYAILTLLASYMPVITGFFGLVYLVAASLLGVWFVTKAVLLLKYKTRSRAKELFWISIYYLLLLFVFMLVDKWWFVSLV